MSSLALSFINTNRGRRLRVAREVSGSLDQAWNLLSKVEHWPEWGPLLTDVRYPHENVRADTTGAVQLIRLFWVPFQIRRVEDYFWSWTVFGLTPPSDGHRVEPLGGNRCRLSFELPLWGSPYAPVCYGALRTLGLMLNDSD